MINVDSKWNWWEDVLERQEKQEVITAENALQENQLGMDLS